MITHNVIYPLLSVENILKIIYEPCKKDISPYHYCEMLLLMDYRDEL